MEDWVIWVIAIVIVICLGIFFSSGGKNSYSYDNFRIMNKYVELPLTLEPYKDRSTTPMFMILRKGEKYRFIAQVDDVECIYLVEADREIDTDNKRSYRMRSIEEWKYLFSNSTEIEEKEE